MGDKAASKERLEVFSGGVVAVLDDFRLLQISSNGNRTKKTAMNQDKGQSRQINETITGFSQKGRAPISFDQLMDTMRVVFAAEAVVDHWRICHDRFSPNGRLISVRSL